MNILGINPSIDASASLINDKKILAAISEERFERIKHLRTFPYQSMNFCLDHAKIDLSDVDNIAVCWNPGIYLEHLSSLRGISYRHYSELLIQIPYSIIKNLSNKNIANSDFDYIKQELKFKNNSKPVNIYYLNHHLSHAAVAFFLSPYKSAAILTIDGYGEETSILMAHANNNEIKTILEIYFPNSLGSVYAAITQYLGFKPNCDEGKVMGLAAWGKPKFYKQLKKIIKTNSLGEIELELNYFSFYLERKLRITNKFIKEFGPCRLKDEKISQFHMDMACSLQKIISDTIINLVNVLHKKTNEKNLCLAGGVALNCAINGDIYNNTPFKNIFVPSAPGDDGNSLGAALYLKHIILKQPRIFYNENNSLGTSFNNETIEKKLKNLNINYMKCDDTAKIAAKLLEQNKIIGWFQGRMEFGPRALGNRSILAHPNAKDVKERLDKKIKFRENFRPYAPSILEEKYNLFFNEMTSSPYMSFCAEVKTDMKNKIKNVIHIDNTARIQTVNKNENPEFYKLINEFYKLTNIPIVLNTSLNTRGKPIVNTIEEALDLFFTTDLDAIFLEDCLISKI